MVYNDCAHIPKKKPRDNQIIPCHFLDSALGAIKKSVASSWPSVATLIGGGLNQAKCLGALPAAFARPGARKTMGIRVCARLSLSQLYAYL